jgi:uncharacterized membrane protein HdeD (DUF308 family)
VDWPESGFWVIGLFVGVEMIVGGWSMIMLTTVVREEIIMVRRQCEAQAQQA